MIHLTNADGMILKSHGGVHYDYHSDCVLGFIFNVFFREVQAC